MPGRPGIRFPHGDGWAAGCRRVVLAMPASRRARPTVRCLVDDLDLALPGLDVDLGDIDHPLLEDVCRLTPSDLLFAALEHHVAPALFEPRSDCRPDP
jgi:hypothetical protein